MNDRSNLRWRKDPEEAVGIIVDKDNFNTIDADPGMGLCVNLNDPEFLEMAQYAEKWQKEDLVWKDGIRG